MAIINTQIKSKAGVYVLGVPEMPLYLIPFENQWMMVEGGVSILSGLVLQQLKELVGDLNNITHWVITHSHYDHCGMLPYLLPYLPNVLVSATDHVAKAFKSKRAIKVIRNLNTQLLETSITNILQTSSVLPPIVSYKDVFVNVLTKNKPFVFSSGKQLTTFSTPGHSRCSHSFLYEPEGILFVSDSLGEMISPRLWLPLVFDNIKDYKRSILALKALDSPTIALGHHDILIGKDAYNAPTYALESLYDFQEICQKKMETGDKIEILIETLYKKYGKKSQAFVSKELFLASMIRMIKLFR